MLQLPNETWSAIFLASHRQRNTIRTVSRFFRDTADRTPQLWTTLALTRPAHFLDLDILRAYLRKSGNLPLDLSIDLPPEITYQSTGPVSALIRPHVSHLRTLSIHAHVQEAIDEFFTAIGRGQPAPLLESLTSSTDAFPLSRTMTAVDSLPDAFLPAPRLTHLAVPCLPLPADTDPHLATLTSLALDARPFHHSLPMTYIFPLLECLPHLQHLTFQGSDEFSYINTSRLDYPLVVPMPHLLSADVAAPGCGLDIFRVLDAPRLTHLRFDGWRKYHMKGRWERSLTEPISFSLRRAARRSPRIKRIELCFIEFFRPDEDYRWLLSAEGFPDLEVLRLDTLKLTDGPLQSSAGGAPTLKRLELRRSKVTGPALIKFVEGRSRDFELVLEQCPFVSPDHVAELSEKVKVVVQP